VPGIWETDAEWRRLQRELAAWQDRRRRLDADGQHRSQLDGCVAVIDAALQELHGPIAATTDADPRAAEHCRVHDRRIAWLRRTWDFFRDRFDQRDDDALAPVLRAADEIAWSCHREAFGGLVAQPPTAGGPPPLPYVEPQLTPEVFPRGLVPGTLRRDVDAAFLRAALDALPFAVVRVPASCVTAPWWLVHLGHEVGHVVDDQLLGHHTRAAMVADLGLSDAAAEEWTRWSGELFADLYAALMFGPWALWALAVAEARDDTAMLVPRDAYPPPAVRLLVMARACDTLGLGTGPVEDGVPLWRALVDADPQQAGRVRDGGRLVDALLATPVEARTWQARTAHEPARWTSASLQPWVARLPTRPAAPPGKPRRRWAREVMAAAVLRRRRTAASGSTFDGESLASDVLSWLPAVREPGARSTPAESNVRTAARGAALAQTLMAAEPLT
jgi:hypothetical protein